MAIRRPYTSGKYEVGATRGDAAAKGYVVYRGKECSKPGHGALRYTCSGSCVACNQIANRAKPDRSVGLRLAADRMKPEPSWEDAYYDCD